MTILPAAAAVRTLLVAVQQVRLYGGDHPAAREAIEQFFRVVQAGLEQGPVQIEIDERTVIVQTIPQPTEDRYVPQLHAHLAARRIGGGGFQREAGTEAAGTPRPALGPKPQKVLAAGRAAGPPRGPGGFNVAPPERTPPGPQAGPRAPGT